MVMDRTVEDQWTVVQNQSESESDLTPEDMTNFDHQAREWVRKFTDVYHSMTKYFKQPIIKSRMLCTKSWWRRALTV